MSKEYFVMLRRKEWLEMLAEKRQYAFSASQSDQFMFIYQVTLANIYNYKTSLDFALQINQLMNSPISTTNILDKFDCIMRKKYKLSTDYIINALKITPSEVSALRIKDNTLASEKRMEQKINKILLKNDIRTDYCKNKLSVIELVNKYNYSRRNIFRIIGDASKAQKNLRDQKIHELYLSGENVSNISKELHCSRSTIYNVLNQGINCLDLSYLDDTCSHAHKTFLENTKKADPHEQDYLVKEIVKNNHDNYLVTGGAGVGKTNFVNTLIDTFEQSRPGSTIVMTPTAIAASHIIGCKTIHHTFKIKPVDLTFKESILHELNNCSNIIIDEISLVSPELFHIIKSIIDEINLSRDSKSKVRLIVCGDFGQLEPISTYYKELYESNDFAYFNFIHKSLNYNFRQLRDTYFQELLARIKFGEQTAISDLNLNSKHYIDIKAPFICGTNKEVNLFNNVCLKSFDNIQTYKAKYLSLGKNSTAYYTESKKSLKLAKGCRVMATINTSSLKNGLLGTVTELSTDSIKVSFDNGNTITIERVLFCNNGKYFKQFPLKLAHALTVHKAQGCTFENINIVPGFFASAQLYTALSRVTSLSGIHLFNKLSISDLKVNSKALSFCI